MRLCRGRLCRRPDAGTAQPGCYDHGISRWHARPGDLGPRNRAGLFLLALGVVAAGSTALAPAGGSAGAAESVAGENIIASELDELFRSSRVPAEISYRRAEAARILLKSSSHAGLSADDRRYLVTLASTVTGLAPEEAQQRVDHVISASTQELHRARVAGVLQAFFAAVALLVGAAVAWYGAWEGGRDRERGHFPTWRRRMAETL